MNIVADDGTMLDASFLVDEHPLSFVIESAGGRTGVNARNRDYGPGLVLALHRLAGVGAVITEIRVDSVVTRRLTAQEQRVLLRRHSLPISLNQVANLDDLKRDISTAARLPGARAGASRGGSSRRLRFVLKQNGWAAPDLERVIAGPGASLEPDTVRRVVNLAAGRAPGTSQGFLVSPLVKRAVEERAMDVAMEHYSKNWDVTDVHTKFPYDLECRRGDEVLYVEVKGSTSTAETVIVTPNEVQHAQLHHPHVELFVVSQIVVDGAATMSPKASGGVATQHRAWGQESDRLRPIAFEYRLGTSRAADEADSSSGTN